MQRSRDTAAEGRFDLDEPDERLERAPRSRTLAEPAALTAALPTPQAPSSLVLKGGMHGASKGPEHWSPMAGLGGVTVRHPNRREHPPPPGVAVS